MSKPVDERFHLKITIRELPGMTILDLAGPFGTGEALEVFRDRINSLLCGGTRHVAINMANVPYMDSSGVAAMVGAHTSFETAGGKCRFFSIHPRVQQLLKMTRVDKVLEIFVDETSVLASFQDGA